MKDFNKDDLSTLTNAVNSLKTTVSAISPLNKHTHTIVAARKALDKLFKEFSIDIPETKDEGLILKYRYLHRHPTLEVSLGLDATNHIIVDKEDWDLFHSRLQRLVPYPGKVPAKVSMRYFIVVYKVYDASGRCEFYGDLQHYTAEGKYANRKDIISFIKKTKAYKNKAWNIWITNITELSESDYNDWIKEEEVEYKSKGVWEFVSESGFKGWECMVCKTRVCCDNKTVCKCDKEDKV